MTFYSFFPLEPNKVYVASTSEVSVVNILDIVTTDSLCDEYTIMFKAGSDGSTLDFSSDRLVIGDASQLCGNVEISIVRTTFQGNNVFKVIITNFE